MVICAVDSVVVVEHQALARKVSLEMSDLVDVFVGYSPDDYTNHVNTRGRGERMSKDTKTFC